MRNVILPGQYYDTESGLSYNWHRDLDPTLGRYVESDPVGLYAGINTYAYVGSDPVLLQDPPGLWSTEAHNAILQYAFPALSWGLQQALQQGSAAVDAPWNQGASGAYEHAMTAPGQSVPDARKMMCRFVKDHLATYNSLAQSNNPGDLFDAYYALGQALHPIMDSTSPAHAGWQPWGNPWSPSWWGAWNQHGDGADSIESLHNLTQALMQQTLQRIKNAMNGKCGCDFQY